MARFSALFGTLIWFLFAPANAATIGLSLPLSGDYASFGVQFKAGAELAFKDANTPHKLSTIDDACSTDGAKQAAQAFISLDVTSVFGFLCNEAAIEVATQLRATNIPVVAAGARSARLIKDREREEWNLWRFSPGDDYPVRVAAQAIVDQWQQVPFAIVDDGTIYGRRFSDNLRQELQEPGLEPQIIDSFRTGLSTQAALVRRLKRTGVSAVFLAATQPLDLVTIINDSSRLNLPFEFITTEALRILPYMDERIGNNVPLSIIDWPDAQSIDFPHIPPENAVTRGFVMGYAAAQIMLQLQKSKPQGLSEQLSQASFDTILGNVSFKADGSSTFNPYRLIRWDGGTFTPATNAGER